MKEGERGRGEGGEWGGGGGGERKSGNLNIRRKPLTTNFRNANY